jgi:tetratricopeptide (TPR) repeat protein
MATVGQLVDQGVRAYIEGRLEEARRLLDDALMKDPANARARSYMILLHGGLPTSPKRAPAPAPAPERAGAAGQAEGRPGPVAQGAEEDYAPSPWDDGPAATATIVLESGGGINLAAVAEKSDLRTLVPEASPQAPPPGTAPGPTGKRDVDVWMSAAKDLLALDDFSGSLEMIEKILKVDPEHPEARAYLKQNEATLVDMYESKLGPLGRVPRLAIKPEEVMWLNLDHRAGFLLSQIDGAVDFESLFALSGLPRLDTARILATLIADGVIVS